MQGTRKSIGTQLLYQNGGLFGDHSFVRSIHATHPFERPRDCENIPLVCARWEKTSEIGQVRHTKNPRHSTTPRPRDPRVQSARKRSRRPRTDNSRGAKRLLETGGRTDSQRLWVRAGPSIGYFVRISRGTRRKRCARIASPDSLVVICVILLQQPPKG